MLTVSIVSTKGGVGKTTVAANLGAFAADAGLRVLLLDIDNQPALSSHYTLRSTAPCGVFELIAHNEQRLDKLVSHTAIQNLDLVISNDRDGQLGTMLLHAPDGRFRLRNLLPVFEANYDLLLIDTQGARSVMLEMAVIASNRLISPVTPEALAAREFKRGTLQLIEDIAPYKRLGIEIPVIDMLINRVPTVSSNARLIQQTLREVFGSADGIRVLHTTIPAIEAYQHSSTLKMPVHRYERFKPVKRTAPAALETIRALTIELFPQWEALFAEVSGKVPQNLRPELPK
ncbi:ParA family protein [Saezia sanguinis]|uniref:ParA family protein n=1 Tax=Saezia sanguinis TaxID=1965230 RepID=UPI003043F6CF